MDRNVAAGTVPLAQAAVAPSSGTPGLFANPDPVLGTVPTVMPPWLWNMVIEEIRNAVIRGGLTPDRTNWHQLADAITAIAQSVTGAVGPYVRQGGGAGQGANVVFIGHSISDSAKLKAQVDVTDFGNIAFEGWVSSVFLPYSNGQNHLLEFPQSTTWTVPSGVTAVRFGVVGGGGGGGCSYASSFSGAGGGGGGGLIGMAYVQPGQAIPITVGAAGVTQVPGARATSGGTSSFGVFGSGAGGGGGGSRSPYCDGGRGGVGQPGTGVSCLLLAGQDGSDGLAPEAVTALGGQLFMGGNGGGSAFGGGGRAGNGGGLAAQGYGGGGGGSYGITASGGSGAPGIVWVQY